MTSNCLLNPNVGQYADRLFTRSIVGWPGVAHIEGDDFSQFTAMFRTKIIGLIDIKTMCQQDDNWWKTR